ncbi:MAG TPA: DUF1751 domain-containing protein [Bdellovibrionales bacterium]|nr:MAG: hypothetical protein A2Z97_04245 [Bdellovibrionales bacterium GWB1_52_6]OFZ03671.1 MAG: hypothetical protein A2X97_01095 [Bdellovibrionales bacterium GWA1_52_35]OFZ42548.1 MAG: hypothetical protein A2070_12555 [Bdellovibrionales bacterium GWC1_52_8]HAR44307.1 DUF1751 domain-containing protein [Bdellovibrionales bacterium]HCM40602.1 DUF1751 domain-containing protein [Bdellovibrionales bacterium]
MQMRLTPAVKYLLIVCFASFLVQQTADQFFSANLTGLFGLVPASFVFQYRFWQIVTYSFLHGDVMHLFLNMMMLVFIGSELESVWGTARFLKFYFICVVAGGLAYLFLQLLSTGQALHIPMVGASAGVYGLLIAYGLLFAERTLLFMMLFPMKAKHFIWVLAGIEFMSTVFSPRGGVAGIAHLGGMAAGWLYLWGWRRFPDFWRKKGDWPLPGIRRERKSKKTDHLKLVVNRDKGRPKSSGNDDDDAPKTWH